MSEKSEAVFNQMFQNFTTVMRGVANSCLKINSCSQTMLVDNMSNHENYYRFLKASKRREETAVPSPESSKKRKMDTSTPLKWRSAPAIESPSSPIGGLEKDMDSLILSDESEEENAPAQAGNTLDLDADKLDLTPPKVEEKVQVVASKTVAANELFEAGENFRKRILSCPIIRGSFIRETKMALNRSKSLSDISNILSPDEVSKWEQDDEFKRHQSDSSSLEQSFKSNGVSDEQSLKSNGVSDEPKVVEDEFQEEDVDQQQLEEIIKEKTRNKLADIFLKQCTGKTLKQRHRTVQGSIIKHLKRKNSSPDEPITPFKMLCDEEEKKMTPRARTQSLACASSRKKKTAKPRTTRNRTRSFNSSLEPGQQRLHRFWKTGVKTNGDDENDKLEPQEE